MKINHYTCSDSERHGKSYCTYCDSSLYRELSNFNPESGYCVCKDGYYDVG